MPLTAEVKSPTAPAAQSQAVELLTVAVAGTVMVPFTHFAPVGGLTIPAPIAIHGIGHPAIQISHEDTKDGIDKSISHLLVHPLQLYPAVQS